MWYSEVVGRTAHLHHQHVLLRLPLCRCRSSSWPTPPENMIRFRYSRRSPFGMRCAKERVKPVITGSPNLI